MATATKINTTDLYFEAGLHAGNANREAIALLKSFRAWNDKEKVDLLRIPFCAGHMVGYAAKSKKVITKDRAFALPALKPYDSAKETDDTRRNAFEELAWQAAKTTWSRAAVAAGKPRREQAPRGKAVGADVEAAATGEAAANAVGALKCETMDQVATFFERTSGMLMRFIQTNASLKMGEYGTLARLFIEEHAKVKAHAAMAGETSEPTAKAA